MNIIEQLDAKQVNNMKYRLNIDKTKLNLFNNKQNGKKTKKYLLMKKKRKKTILNKEEKCQAIINNGKQCSRRKKYGEFCGKHKDKQPFGIVDENFKEEELIFNIDDENIIEVRKFNYQSNEYLIDNNRIIFNKKGTQILGKLNNNNEVYFIKK